MTATDIQALAQQYLAPDKMLSVRVVSETAAADPKTIAATQLR